MITVFSMLVLSEVYHSLNIIVPKYMEVLFSEHGVYELMLMQLRVKLKYSKTVIVEIARIMET